MTLKFIKPWQFDAYYTFQGEWLGRILDAKQQTVCMVKSKEQADAILASIDSDDAQTLQDLWVKRWADREIDIKSQDKYRREQADKLLAEIYKLQDEIEGLKSGVRSEQLNLLEA
jgi:hypothetical protein